MALRRKIVDLGRLRFLHDADEIGRIGHIAVMQEEVRALDMRVGINVIDARRVERRGPPLHAVNDIAFRQQQLRQISAVLAGDAGNEGDFVTHSFTLMFLRRNCPETRLLIAAPPVFGNPGPPAWLIRRPSISPARRRAALPRRPSRRMRAGFAVAGSSDQFAHRGRERGCGFHGDHKAGLAVLHDVAQPLLRIADDGRKPFAHGLQHRVRHALEPRRMNKRDRRSDTREMGRRRGP